MHMHVHAKDETLAEIFKQDLEGMKNESQECKKIPLKWLLKEWLKFSSPKVRLKYTKRDETAGGQATQDLDGLQ